MITEAILLTLFRQDSFKRSSKSAGNTMPDSRVSE